MAHESRDRCNCNDLGPYNPASQAENGVSITLTRSLVTIAGRSISSVDEFSYDENRGSPDAPLSIINHFITLARPSNQTINDADILGQRAEQCAAERGRQPNLIAVDFIGEGDVMTVVDSLNLVD